MCLFSWSNSGYDKVPAAESGGRKLQVLSSTNCLSCLFHNLNHQLVPRGKTQLINVVKDAFKLTTKVNCSACFINVLSHSVVPG